MHQDILNAAQELLKKSEEFYIPLKRLWKKLYSQGSVPTLEEFTKMLKRDKRFYISPELQDQKEDKELEAEAEEMDFYEGPLVGLKDRTPTKEKMKAILGKKMENMISVLQEAYRVKPPDDESEKRLLEIMIKTKKLKEELDEVLGGEK